MNERAEVPTPGVRIVLIWAAILGCAMVNGFLREVILAPSVGMTAANVLSGLILSACIVVAAILSAEFLGMDDAKTGFRIGASWLVMTAGFEFLFGLTLRGQTMRELLDPYTFEAGNLWPIVLATLLIAPWRIGAMRALRPVRPRRQSPLFMS